MARRARTRRTRTLTDISIPAGTEAVVEPNRTTCYVNCVSVLIAHGPDRTSEWMMPLEDAVSLGLVAPPPTTTPNAEEPDHA